MVSALPETWLVHLIRMADEDPDMTLVRLAKEEEGVGVSAGAHFAGVKSAMLMQNHGFLQAINGIVGVSLLYKIPLLMLITDRGGFGEKDPWQTEGGKHTRPVLDALHIAHDDLTRRSEEHTSELQSRVDLVCRLLLEKKKKKNKTIILLNNRAPHQIHVGTRT